MPSPVRPEDDWDRAVGPLRRLDVRLLGARRQRGCAEPGLRLTVVHLKASLRKPPRRCNTIAFPMECPLAPDSTVDCSAPSPRADSRQCIHGLHTRYRLIH